MVRPASRPTLTEVLAARDRTVPDLIAPGLSVLFCGINPSLYSAAVGCHFARPGNRFWPTLYEAGFTPRRLGPEDGPEFVALGLGITNVVARATSAADELTPAELIAGGEALAAKVRRYRPQCLAVLGVTAYRVAFGRRRAAIGRQPEALEGALLWALPNPSGRCVSFRVGPYAELLAALKR